MADRLPRQSGGKGGGRLATRLVLLAVVVTLVTALILQPRWPVITADYDRYVVGFERVWRKAFWSAKIELPGTPDLAAFDTRLAAKGFRLGDPVFLRIFKREFRLEVWMRRKGSAVFEQFESYPICYYSGRLGPKLKEGDRQAPEGVYTVSASQLNPNSRWHKSFNLGFPNLYDRSLGRTGSFLMVHGGCSSIGCYAMTDDVIDEIWALVTSALKSGQSRFQVQVFPFEMTEAALSARAGDRWHPFWRQLKEAHDLFQSTGVPPEVSVCRGRYAFAPGVKGSDGSNPIRRSCPSRSAAAGE